VTDRIKAFFEEHKGMRRLIVAVMVVWISAAIAVGLYHLTDLTANSNTFLLAVLGLLSVPIGFYFYHRGKS
jgi:hypothetical protein